MLTKLTVFVSVSNSSRPASEGGTLPGGTVLMSREPGGGGCGFAGFGVVGLCRVFSGCSGFSLEEELWPSGLTEGGTLALGNGALFCGAGASGSFCCWHMATAVASASNARTTTLRMRKQKPRLSMDGVCPPGRTGTLHSIEREEPGDSLRR